jgi:hypothetical protein
MAFPHDCPQNLWIKYYRLEEVVVLRGFLPIVCSYLALTGDYSHAASDRSGITDILLVITHR